ncbi:MAG TPA: hypothetical protein VH041_13300 [Caldimonas sp.]|nr:hypothetical protein [Caldimonas sp.]HEX4235267.1 hypothetical protein [Caldimonas sp.]
MKLLSAFCAGAIASIILVASPAARALEPDELPADGLKNASIKSGASLRSRGYRSRIGQGHTNSGLPLDTLLNWNGHFRADGVDSNGMRQVIWYYNMIGNRPELGGTTFINAPIVPVIVDLRNADGSPRFVNGHPLVSYPTQYVQPVLDSPVFQNASYSSSPVPTQITDAVMRAEFQHSAKDDWHTLLNPVVRMTRTMVLLRGTYQFSLNADGTCCRFILVDANTFVNALFPSFLGDTSSVIGKVQAAGEMTTQDLSTFLFPNTFLFDSSGCCILGFHSFDFEPVGIGQAFVMNYSSWISPGLFGGGFQDITAVSHEIAETFNDPLVAYDGVHNITPWWLAPNGNCQNNLETGDVIEGLPKAVFPITLFGFTYHPQNEALLQWFEFESPSSAIGGAYSYPDTTTLTALSAPQKVNCQ